MSPLAWVGVGAVGAVGALARFALDGLVSARSRSELPWGTLAVNASGALALGLATGAALGGDAATLLGGAAIGSYTTFSTWMLETQRLAEDGRLRWALANVGLSLAVGLSAAAAGRALGGAL